jgi:imidazolonepropionase
MGGRGAIVAAGLATAAVAPARGRDLAAQTSPGPIGVAWEDGRIVAIGPPEDLPWAPTLGTPEAGLLAPGFVDAHTHLPFVGWRADEYEARLAGATYRDQHGGEGGIFRSARMLREADDEEVLAFSLVLAREMLASGTTALELKTGYGLSVDQELRQARLARALAARAPQICTVTLLAAHAVPSGMTRAGWVERACEELVPAAAAEGLCDQVDVYVEDIAFDLDDLERIAAAASAAGLPLRVHAEQLGASGAAEAAARQGARSADHLNRCPPAGVAALGAAPRTAAVLLPTSSRFLGLAPAPATALRDAGAVLALATDCNPGTSPVTSMPEVIQTACADYRLTPAEALSAATANPAWVLGLEGDLGRLAPGLRADVLLLDVPTLAHVPYRPGRNPVSAVVVAGEVLIG